MFLDDLKARDPVAWFAITRTLPLEGGLVDNATDPGGVTDRGVSMRFALAEIGLHPDELPLFDIDHDGHVDRWDITVLTPDEAAAIYDTTFWQRYGYGRLTPQLVAWKVFDICVNTGPKRAATLLQESVGDLGHAVKVDGTLGQGTLAAVKACSSLPLISALRLRQAAFYRDLVARQPKLKTFLTGWLNRAGA